MSIDQSKMVNIDFCIKQLKIGRRRIYDIINILESLKIVQKKEKNLYEWNGYEIV